MAKVVNNSSTSNGFKFLFVFVGLALLVVNALAIAFVFYMLRLNSEYKTRYTIDESRFESVVSFAVSNYLFSIGYNPSASKVDDKEEKSPLVAVRDGCTWLDAWGRYHCMIDGLDYSVGDFCEDGLILLISDMRVYVKVGESVKILRLKYIDKAVDEGGGDERPARVAATAKDGPDI